MLKTIALAALIAQTGLAAPLAAQPPEDRPPRRSAASPAQQPHESKADSKPAAIEPAAEPSETPVTTTHAIMIGGKTIHYTATAAQMPIRSRTGETEAHIFYIAYTVTDTPKEAVRPLLFAFNGGPGSASLWLHMGAIGPKRVKLGPNGSLPPPPYMLVDNESSWLDKADLVFIDPVGTGFSRAVKPELGSKFWSVDGDIESLTEFIRLYLTRNKRWGAPLFVAGESYGTVRGAGLAHDLLDHGISLSGLALISSLMNFRSIEAEGRNDSAYPLILPTYAAAAWYHHKLPKSVTDLRRLLAEAERWAEDAYPTVLAHGDNLTPAERKEALDRLERYTGLERRILNENNLRINMGIFMTQLLHSERLTLGAYDSRYVGMAGYPTPREGSYDPSYTAVRAPFTTLFNQYVHSDLNYQTEMPYYVLGEGLTSSWNYGPGGESSLDMSGRLRSALVENPFMKLLVAAGHYDLVTPFYQARYTMSHLGLPETIRKNVTFREYEAGHMMYLDTPSRMKLKADVAAWIDSALLPGAAAR